jgi:hypothetical protein
MGVHSGDPKWGSLLGVYSGGPLLKPDIAIT